MKLKVLSSLCFFLNGEVTLTVGPYSSAFPAFSNWDVESFNSILISACVLFSFYLLIEFSFQILIISIISFSCVFVFSWTSICYLLGV